MTEESQETPQETEASKPRTIVDDTNEAVARLEAANKRTEELLLRQENLAAQKALSGKAEAGKPQEKPKEESDKEYAEKMLNDGQ